MRQFVRENRELWRDMMTAALAAVLSLYREENLDNATLAARSADLAENLIGQYYEKYVSAGKVTVQ